MTIYGCNFVLFWSFSMPRYFPCIILSGMAKISGWLHYFEECKKLVPCLDKLGVFKNCLSSAPASSLGDPKALVAHNSTWQCQAFSLRVIFYEADNMLQRRVQSSVVWQGFCFSVDIGDNHYLSDISGWKVSFFRYAVKKQKCFPGNLMTSETVVWAGSLHISSFFLYVHLPGLPRISISSWSAVSFKHWNLNSTTVSFKNKKEQGCSFAPRLHWENVERNIWMHSSLTSSETSLRSGFSCRSSWPPLPSSHGVSADDFSHLLWGSLRKLPPRSCNSESSTFAKEQG